LALELTCGGRGHVVEQALPVALRLAQVEQLRVRAVRVRQRFQLAGQRGPHGLACGAGAWPWAY